MKDDFDVLIAIKLLESMLNFITPPSIDSSS